MKSMIENLAHAADRPRLMREMMTRFAVSEDAAPASRQGLGLAQAARRCAGCRHEGACVSWLETHDHADHAPSFCANDGFFEAIKSGS
jgi:hypothetical protein